MICRSKQPWSVIIRLQTFSSMAEACQRREEAQWRQRWPPTLLGLQRLSRSNEEAWHRGRLPPLATQWHLAGSQLWASGGGSVEASGWLLEARTGQAEIREAQRRARGARSWLRGGKPPEAILGPILLPTPLLHSG